MELVSDASLLSSAFLSALALLTMEVVANPLAGLAAGFVFFFFPPAILVAVNEVDVLRCEIAMLTALTFFSALRLYEGAKISSLHG